MKPIVGVLMALAWISSAAAAPPRAARPQHVRVELAGSFHAPESGRLLLFAMPRNEAAARAGGGRVSSVDASLAYLWFKPGQVLVAAQEVHRLMPGSSVIVDADLIAFPKPFSQLKPGTYDVQAVLDVNHDYNYAGRVAPDVLSAVTPMHLGGGSATIPGLRLVRRLPPQALWSWSTKTFFRTSKAVYAQAHAHTDTVDFLSRDLSAFWGRPIHMRALVIRPPGYDAHPRRRYPVVYFTQAFGGNLRFLTFYAAKMYEFMRDGQMPPMIWVLLDEAGPTGTVEFANSVNDGPWGTALTRELIPHLESVYRMDGDADGRFLTGHSSGGWAALWLQTRYPAFFGGTWPVAPDPSDFHAFITTDLYAPDANVYYAAGGKLRPLVRIHGKVVATFRQIARIEEVLGRYGGQLASFEWVFSPRGRDGRPQQMFNRETGAVNPRVAAYWRAHYDIAHRLKTHWRALAPYLDGNGGKIHLYVGTADNFYLDGPARRLETVLNRLHARTHFHFVPGRNHGDVYAIGKDRYGLMKKIAWQMYAIARPHSALHPPVAAAAR